MLSAADFFAVVHDRVHELRDDDVPELRIPGSLHAFQQNGDETSIRFSRLFSDVFAAVLRTALLAVLDALGIEDARGECGSERRANP